MEGALGQKLGRNYAALLADGVWESQELIKAAIEQLVRIFLQEAGYG